MLVRSLLAEAIGVFALCLIGGGSIIANEYMSPGGGGIVGIALAHGIILAVVVSATMNVSGGHINPAVTVAMLLVGRIKIVPALAYIVAQCAGGLVAGMLLSFFIFNNVTSSQGRDPIAETWNGSPHYSVAALGVSDTPMAAPAPTSTSAPITRAIGDAGIAARRAIIIEAALTFLLMFAIYGTAVDKRHPNIGGLAIGLTITALILVGGPLTGAAMNPARALGTGWWWPETHPQMWVYWVGPCVGAVLCAFIYEYVIIGKGRPEAAE